MYLYMKFLVLFMITVLLVFICELTQKLHRDAHIIDIFIILRTCLMTNVFIYIVLYSQSSDIRYSCSNSLYNMKVNDWSTWC